ncbi:PAS domain-containing protein, partial [Tateyamaria pelophila]|uniref:PAS domain-containing protein n=1 Tax=Tateyamaria pelophila TaxID=328415 RepID=UPI001CC05B37
MSADDFFKCVHSDDRLTLEAEAVQHFAQGGEFTRAFKFVRPDGAMRHIIWHSSFERPADAALERIGGLFIDVTQSRMANPAVAPDRETVLGSYDLDLHSGELQWSPELRSVFNRQEGVSVTEEAVRECIHPDDRGWVVARMHALKSIPGPYALSFRVVQPDGEVLRVRDTGMAHGSDDPTRRQVSRVTGQLIDVSDASDGNDLSALANDTFWRLVDTAPIGVYLVDADMKMARVNKSGLAAFAEIDNLIGRSLDEILHILWPDHFAAEAVAQFRHTLDSGDRYDAEPVIEDRADRKTLEAYDWSIERIMMEDGRPGVLCYFYDLTERVRNERALEEQRQLLSLAYKSANMGAWEVDVNSGDTVVTPHLSALFGHPDFKGSFTELFERAIHPDDLSRFNEAFMASVESGKRFDEDFRIRVNGETRYIATSGEAIYDFEGRPSKFIGINQDVTDRKMAEFAVLHSERRLRAVINKTIAFMGVLTPEGILQDVNEPALEFAGLPATELLGKPFYETFWWTHDETASNRCRDAVIAGQAGQTERFDVVVRGAGDTLVTIDFMLAPVFDDDGNLQMLVASGFDISAREEARAREKDLMGEINHRTKNILALVQSVARQTAKSGDGDFLPRFEGRLNALAKAQDLLFESSVDKVELHDLIGSQLNPDIPQVACHLTRRSPDQACGSSIFYL